MDAPAKLTDMGPEVEMADDFLEETARTIFGELEHQKEYKCPIKFLSDGTRVTILFWVENEEEGLTNTDFGISVTATGLNFSHTIYNITTCEDINTTFLKAQILKTRGIAEKQIDKMCGTLGRKKKQAMIAFGNNPVHMGIKECCVCFELTTTKTVCQHAVCIPCLLRVNKCPLCRTEAFCQCCVKPDEYSDDEFDA
jgi:hypothetical protein